MTSLTTRLEEALPNLSASDVNFASSLLTNARRMRNGPSAKMAHWMEVLIERAANPEPEEGPEGDFLAVFTFLGAAGERLRFPKVRLTTADGDPVVLSRAGDRSRNPGHINVTDGGPYGDNVWYGRIDHDGKWHTPRRPIANMEAVVETVARFAENPEAAAREHGKLTRACSFCAKDLTDDRSLAVGYGPVCAEKWNLPWGASVEMEILERERSLGTLAEALEAA